MLLLPSRLRPRVGARIFFDAEACYTFEKFLRFYDDIGDTGFRKQTHLVTVQRTMRRIKWTLVFYTCTIGDTKQLRLLEQGMTFQHILSRNSDITSCTRHTRDMLPLVLLLHAYTDLPLYILADMGHLKGRPFWGWKNDETKRRVQQRSTLRRKF